MRRKRTGYWKVFLICLAALALLLAAALGVLWQALSRYQATQDAAALAKAEARAPQLAFESFLAQATPEYWTEQWLAQNPQSYDRPEDVRAEMERLFQTGEISCWKADGYTPQTPVYLVKNGDAPLASVTMDGRGTDWRASAVELCISGDCGGSITVPADCAALCNGMTLDASLAKPAESPYETKDYDDALQNPVSWVTYTVTGLLREPELTAQAPAGKTLTQIKGRYVYVLPEDRSAPYRQEGESFALALAKFYMMGANNTRYYMWRAAGYCRNGSQAWNTVLNALEGVVWGRTYYYAQYKVSTDYVVLLSDNCMILDVPFVTKATIDGEVISEGVYRIYFVDYGGGYEICGLFLM